MAYKLMAVDIDGTLLNSKGELTEKTKEAIRLGVQNGLIFTIATGRPVQGVEYLNRALGLDLPFITYNGAMVVMGRSGKILYEQRLSFEDSRDIIELGKKYSTAQMIWVNNGLFVTIMDERADRYKRIGRVEPVLAENTDELIKNGTTKVLWYDEVENIEKYQSEAGKVLKDTVVYHTSQPYFLEFVDKNASKAIAMEKLGEHYGIKRSEMIAVGDGYNDLSMIEYAGLGVAMENSPGELKEKADYVTLSNDEDGVAHVIDQFVLAHI